MKTLTINIEDTKSEKALLEYLDNMGVAYSIDLTEKNYSWWKDRQLVDSLENRSTALKNGSDKGLSFSDIKASLLKK